MAVGAGNDVVDRLAGVLDELAGTDPSVLADADGMRSLSRSLNRLEAALSRTAAAYESSGDWAETGALNLPSWMATEGHLPLVETRRRVRLGRALRRLPAAAEAWAEGEISSAHVARLVGVLRPRTEEAMARDEEMLVEKAKSFRFDHFNRLVAYWEGLADEDGTEDEAEARRSRRDAYLVKTFDGAYLGRMAFDPISGAVVGGEMERLEKLAFEEDWAEAKARLGHDPVEGDLCRTAAQRRADAMVEMAMRSRTAPADGIRPAPLFTVMVGYETMQGRICELANGGGVLSPGQLLPWLDRALIERAVFTPKGRVEVSARARLFTGATLRALQIRDRDGCTHPYCHAPAWRCQADHVQPYNEGGPTTQENGRMVCGPHNRARNSGPDHPLWRRRFLEHSDDPDHVFTDEASGLDPPSVA